MRRWSCTREYVEAVAREFETARKQRYEGKLVLLEALRERREKIERVEPVAK